MSLSLDINESSKQVVNVVTLYTGLATMKVIAINPSMDELKALGLPAQKEPEYTTTEDILDENKQVVGNYPKTRIDVWIKSEAPKIQTKVSFWIEGRNRTSQDGGKNQWININGVTAWAAIGVNAWETDSNKNWFKADGARIARPGEEDLHEWLRAWANVENGKRCQLSNMDAIAKGDVSELRSLIQPLAKNEVRYLLGVNNGYQTVYNKMFGRVYEKSTTRWIKKLEDKYGVFKADYQNDLNLREYVANVTNPDGSSNPAAPTGSAPAGGTKLVF
jgi:hypothetical protein